MQSSTQFITIALVLCALSSAAVSQADTAVIDKFIATQAAKERGEEYPDARKILTGDLNGDGIADTAVLYTIEAQNGSNNYIQYLAVFLHMKSGLVHASHAPVGGKNHRDIELASIGSGLINLNTVAYGPKDPSCCPTIKGTTRYALSHGLLKEQRSKNR